MFYLIPKYCKRLPLIPGSWYKPLIFDIPHYPKMKIKIFSNIRPAALVHSSNSGEMEALYSILVPIFVIFVQIPGMDRIFKSNNRPEKKGKDPSSSISDLYHVSARIVITGIYYAFKRVSKNN